ncbi:MAG: DNA polymerase III subunit gamma/tau [Bauldia sp.]
MAGNDATPSDAAPASAYRVLARKYRPRTFADLIGQEPMVRTLRNAFETGRIAQAYMLTGVRGVGKTTTARILARALNYRLPGKVDRPSLDMSELGEHCAAIMEGRHIDVIEMDAASHTGIGDIREIADASRYRPAIARYKVYIIDEVHMLSNQAFNGLLKTLEEPPPHVKFIFATTEIRKVPVTVLSRCQRFDLRRIEAGTLSGLLADIAGKEGISIDAAALALIARAAEGSARDALSLLDQAAAHGRGTVSAAEVQAMLGLADRAVTIDLFEALMRGDAAAALAKLADLYRSGADPGVVLQDLAAFTHVVTRFKVTPAAADDPVLTEEERTRGRAFAEKLSHAVLARAWQMLLKGIEEVQTAGRPLPAADMVLVRIAYAADLPTPDEALRRLRDSGSGTARTPSAERAPAPPAPTRPTLAATSGGSSALARAEPQAAAAVPQTTLRTFADLVAKAAEERDIRLKIALETVVRPIRFEPGKIEIALTESAPPGLVADLGKRLQEWTGSRWLVAIGQGAAAPTIAEARESSRVQAISDARADPLVAEVMKRFPGAEIVDVRIRGEAAPAFQSEADLVSPADPENEEDD